jgi:RND family efflux transporter MFP subunit
VQRPPVRGVTVATLAATQVDDVYEVAGTVKASAVAVVASRMMGTVTSLAVREGDPVEKGQLLLTLEDSDVVQKVRMAEAGHREALKALEAAGQNRELADITQQRYGKMYEEKAISRQEMDQFETQKRVAALEYERVQELVNRAAAGLSEAKIHLGFTRVTSPVQGRIAEKRTEVGSMAVPGMPLLTVESHAAFHVEIPVDEGMLPKVRVGVPVTVSIEALQRQTAGKITEILPAVDPLSRTATAKVALGGAGLRSGLYAKIRMRRGVRVALLIPRRAVVEKGQLTGAYTVDSQGVITYRLIRTGEALDSRIEVLSGLKPGDRIIVQGVEKALDGGVLQ